MKRRADTLLSKSRHLVLLFALVVFSSQAIAQLYGGALDLRDEDIAMAQAAAQPLYANPDTPIGTSATWDNPATGNRGSVTLVAINTINGTECRRLSHLIFVKDQADPFNFLVDRCFINGEWRVYP